MNNTKEAQKLIKKYNSITLEEIEELITSRNLMFIKTLTGLLSSIQNKLTGFGTSITCTLCQCTLGEVIQESIFDEFNICKDCIYGPGKKYSHRYSCVVGSNRLTYDAIAEAITPEQLLKTYKNRAKHIQNILNKWKQNQQQ